MIKGTNSPTTKQEENHDRFAVSLTEITKSQGALDLRDQHAIVQFLTERVRPLRAQIAADFDPIIRDAYQAHKRLLALRDKYDKPLAALEKRLKETVERIDRAAREVVRLAARAAEEEGLPAIAVIPEKPQEVSYTTKHRWSIVDLDKVKAEFRISVPDKDKIDLAVRKYGTEAPKIVGGIAVEEYRQVAVRAR